jgi:aromatic-L-amino-acid decarboxylase
VVDWIADYLEGIEARRVAPDVRPGEIRGALPVAPPERGEPFEAWMGDFERLIVPGMTHWQHPGWLAYFPSNTSPASVLGEMLAAGLGAQCMSWQTSPAATELEQVVLDWLRQLLGLPDAFTGALQDTASSSTLLALLAARERATGLAFAERGAGAPGADRLVAYASEEAHSSVEKAARLAGYGQANLRRVATDSALALRPERLAAALEADVAAGLVPACVVATAGTTSTSAFDPLGPISDLCRRHGAWLHVDGAYGGVAGLLPEKRHLLAGLEGADSFVVNPHKWLLTNFDCSAFYVRDPAHLVRVFSTSPEYLKTAVDDRVVNFRDWGIPLGRRFRALKLWFVLRAYGAEGLRELLRGHVALAAGLAARLEAHDDFELLAPAPLGLVCFRCRPAGAADDDPRLDAWNARLLEAVNASGRVFLTSTRVRGRLALRASIGQRTTGARHVDECWRLLVANRPSDC